MRAFLALLLLFIFYYFYYYYYYRGWMFNGNSVFLSHTEVIFGCELYKKPQPPCSPLLAERYLAFRFESTHGLAPTIMGLLEVESGWLLSLSIAAKCLTGDSGGGGAADPCCLLGLAALALLAFLSIALLHWASPGGPAWGKHRWNLRHKESAAIPGPRGLPLIGSMRLMAGLAHRKLAAAAAELGAGRLMALSLGGTRVIITSDPDVAKEILNSSAFADRPVRESAYGLMFHRAIGFAPYGPYWRALRRIASTHLFSPKQIAASAAQRAEIASQMVASLGGSEGRPVHVRDVLKAASLNNVMWTVFGRRYELGGARSEEMAELRCLVEQGYDLLGELNWSDHLPFLSRFDPQGVRSRCSQLVPRVNRFVSRIIKEHRTRGSKGELETTPDFVDVLLSLQGSDRLSDPDMVAVLWEMIFRGTDTVAVLIEWVLARLVLHPDVQALVQGELDTVVGRTRAVRESDACALPYLHAVLKEALRMHPPGPLLSWARLATHDALVDGRLVPAGTVAMVNMWAITHDPQVWSDPLDFRPDRFLVADVPLLGSDLRLAPFGSGRRSCPGKALALATVAFWVASLLHEFELRPASDGGPRVDLSEVLRLSCEMATPLAVKLLPRRI